MGRPKSASKRDNRKRPVNLSESAFIKLQILRRTTDFNFSKFVSDCINEKFPVLGEEEIMVYKVYEQTKKRDLEEEKLLKQIEKLKEIKKQKE
jgi:hypothetical protein